MAISAARQRNAVSEGFALGLCILERYEFPFEKMRVELAFENAWRDWPERYKSQFSQVATDLRNGTDAVWVMTHADQGKRTMVFFWEVTGPKITIYGRSGDWNSDDPEDVAYAVRVIDGDVPIEGWVSLAQEFVSHLDR